MLRPIIFMIILSCYVQENGASTETNNFVDELMNSFDKRSAETYRVERSDDLLSIYRDLKREVANEILSKIADSRDRLERKRFANLPPAAHRWKKEANEAKTRSALNEIMSDLIAEKEKKRAMATKEANPVFLHRRSILKSLIDKLKHHK